MSRRSAVRGLLPAVVVGLLLLGLSALPAGSGSLFDLPFLPPHADKMAHVLTRTLLGALLARAFGRQGRSAPMALGLAVLLTGLHGAADEGLQSLVPGRDPSLADLAANLAGGLVGAAGVLAWPARRSLPEPHD